MSSNNEHWDKSIQEGEYHQVVMSTTQYMHVNTDINVALYYRSLAYSLSNNHHMARIDLSEIIGTDLAMDNALDIEELLETARAKMGVHSLKSSDVPIPNDTELAQNFIMDLDLSPRTFNSLKRANITNVQQILEMSDAKLLSIRNFGIVSLNELKEKLTSINIDTPQKKNSVSSNTLIADTAKPEPVSDLMETPETKPEPVSDLMETPETEAEPVSDLMETPETEAEPVSGLADWNLGAVDIESLLYLSPEHFSRERIDLIKNHGIQRWYDLKDHNFGDSSGDQFWVMVDLNKVFKVMDEFLQSWLISHPAFLSLLTKKDILTLIFNDKSENREANIIYERITSNVTLETLGGKYGVTRERIRQLEIRGSTLWEKSYSSTSCTPAIIVSFLVAREIYHILQNKHLHASVANLSDEMGMDPQVLKALITFIQQRSEETQYQPYSIQIIHMDSEKITDNDVLAIKPEMPFNISDADLHTTIQDILSGKPVLSQDMFIGTLQTKLGFHNLDDIHADQIIYYLQALKFIQEIPSSSKGEKLLYGKFVCEYGKHSENVIQLISACLYSTDKDTNLPNTTLGLYVDDINKYVKATWHEYRDVRATTALMERTKNTFVKADDNRIGIFGLIVPSRSNEVNVSNDSIPKTILSILESSNDPLGFDEIFTEANRRGPGLSTSSFQVHLGSYVKSGIVVKEDKHYKLAEDGLDTLKKAKTIPLRSTIRSILNNHKTPLHLDELFNQVNEVRSTRPMTFRATIAQMISSKWVNQVSPKYFTVGTGARPKSDQVWIERFQILKSLHDQGIDINNPSKFPKIEDRKRLINWCAAQKRRFSNIELSKERIEKLQSIGFELSSRKRPVWEQNFQLLKSLHDQGIDINSPSKLPDIENRQQLIDWCKRQRYVYNQKKLSKERIEKLQSIGFELSSRKRPVWEQNFQLLKSLHDQGIDINSPSKLPDIENRQQLIDWCKRQRYVYNHKGLSQERIEKFQSIGFEFELSPRNSDGWEQYFQLLKSLHDQGIDINSSSKLPDIENRQQLIDWCHRQRYVYKQKKLSQERIEKFQSIGFELSSRNSIGWEQYFRLLKSLHDQGIDINISSKLPDIENRQQLIDWRRRQRYGYNQKKLSEERIEKLQSIGFKLDVNYD